jgi:hypothetical protein
MTPRTKPVLLLAIAVALTGCANTKVRPLRRRNPVADRSAYIERRADELIRRGISRERALGQASGDWFNESLAADTRLDDAQRAESARLDAALARARKP